MRRRMAHGLAVFFCVASLGATQRNSGSAHNRSGPVPPQPKAATRSSKKSKPYQVGTASWYGSYFQGKDTASGEAYNMYDFTAAHPSLPLGTYVRVTNLRNGRAVVVRINDRGPVVDGRIIDMSYGAAQALGMKSRGLQQVRLDLVEAPPTVAELRPVAHLN